MRVVVAPDCFSGTLTAVEAADAIATGWRSHAPDDELLRIPLADGGPGFVDVLHARLGGRLVPAVVTGPMGDSVPAAVLVVDDDRSGSPTGYVESALACGLHLIPLDRRDPAAMTSAGVADLLVAAVGAGARRLVIGLGGSGVNDGGAGLLHALGGLGAARDRLVGVDVVIASDIDSPLLGPTGASLGFARQKGAEVAELPRLEAAMSAWASTVVAQAEAVGVGHADRLPAAAGAGAAGGIGFALLALGAHREPGAQVVADAVGLEDIAASADVLVTGEGSFDWQSLRGKVVTAVARTGQRTGRPVVVIAGQVLVGRREFSTAGIDAAYAVVDGRVTVAEALRDAAVTLTARARRVAATWSHPRAEEAT